MTTPSTDTRVCPFCAETIKREAIKCRYCGSDLAPLQDAPPQPHGLVHGRRLAEAIDEFNRVTRGEPLTGNELDGLGAENVMGRSIRRMSSVLQPGEVTLGIGTAYLHTSLGTLWLTKIRLLHFNAEYFRLNPDTQWLSDNFVQAEFKPGLLYGRLMIYRRGDRPILFKRAVGCGMIVDAINRGI